MIPCSVIHAFAHAALSFLHPFIVVAFARYIHTLTVLALMFSFVRRLSSFVGGGGTLW